MAHQAMSMEAMLDEERRMVLELLEGNNARTAVTSRRGLSPQTSPRSAVRSMLDFDEPPPAVTKTSPRAASARPAQPPHVRSMLDIDSKPAQQIKSMLDVGPSPPAKPKPLPSNRPVLSNPPSPVLQTNKLAHNVNAGVHHPRSASDAASNPVGFGPKASSKPSMFDPTDYRFGEILPATVGPSMPKRTTLLGKAMPSALSSAFRGNELPIPGEAKGRHNSIAGPTMSSSNKSTSPGSRLSIRSHSPASALTGRPISPAGRQLLAETVPGLDMNNAYRKLSDANLALSGGSLAQLGQRSKAAKGRLIKDYLNEGDSALIEDSSDERNDSSDDEDERGRTTARSFENARSNFDQGKGKAPLLPEQTARKTFSLLAAAEEERLAVASTQPKSTYRSLLDEPEITVTNPSGERVRRASSRIHPATSFDDGSPAGSRTPREANANDNDVQVSDIKRAQKMNLTMTPITATPDADRAIRIIYRGEYSRVVQEAKDEHRRLRKYLCATDLSDESAHALEWAVGTCLRDGDTLCAIYCVDEETGIPSADATLPAAGGHLAALKTDRTASPAPSASGRRAEAERFRAVQDITDRVTKLLRKTKLQVRVIIEVLHCKNPGHVILEVIDTIQPTLVVLGSRGRSALKGVILGSFSNYLVTKSSVPVMVARKRLKKQSKYKRPVGGQVNNLHSPTARLLENAKVD